MLIATVWLTFSQEGEERNVHSDLGQVIRPAWLQALCQGRVRTLSGRRITGCQAPKTQPGKRPGFDSHPSQSQQDLPAPWRLASRSTLDLIIPIESPPDATEVTVWREGGIPGRPHQHSWDWQAPPLIPEVAGPPGLEPGRIVYRKSDPSSASRAAGSERSLLSEKLAGVISSSVTPSW
ncbi:hypothetical protein P7K49_009031 [Saguinus oedipus]|uniref:Uncharacterized protein n=1 Tax=Saguinus oedipus TaxID=9490 RepID=A0ABQ9W064_SAGOE|nr:hypothetical protein P7K49_009031 [Saguinus oedipus]